MAGSLPGRDQGERTYHCPSRLNGGLFILYPFMSCLYPVLMKSPLVKYAAVEPMFSIDDVTMNSPGLTAQRLYYKCCVRALDGTSHM